MKNVCAGLDIGGHTVGLQLALKNGELLGPYLEIPTKKDNGPEATLFRVRQALEDHVRQQGLDWSAVAAVGLGCAGPQDLEAGRLLVLPNFPPSWHNYPIREKAEEIFKVPVYFQNDANVAGYGETWVGAAKGKKSVVGYTLGTGIGGWIIINGVIIDGAHSHGGELGHTKIALPGLEARLCGCTKHGCLEAYASVTALEKMVEEELPSNPSSLLSSRWPVTAAQDRAKVVFDLALREDHFAKDLVRRIAFYLAVGAVNMGNSVNPEAIVYVGGMSKAGKWFIDLIRQNFLDLAMEEVAAKTEILLGTLGNKAGAIGAAGWAWHELER